MTPDMRVDKWFRKIPEARQLDLATRISICKKVTNIMIVAFVLILILEFVIAFSITNGEIFNIMAEKINLVVRARRRHKLRNLVVASVIVVGPFLILPIIFTQILKRVLVAREVRNILTNRWS
ncbi:hypothetical protein HMPREF9089_01342 [Eubacterium brachy ATCC 33089]|jgi:hypothetical protein|nr:hypothetical protein HMPREF9089_01342 [Eubacterium brachy ATCC 33089]